MLVAFTASKLPSDTFIYMAYQKYCQIFNKKFDKMEIVRNGKPYFSINGQKAKIFFSLTHSGDYIFVAISDKNVGIDLQLHNKKNIAEVSNYLFGTKMSEKQFYDRFVAGEAHVKCAETGLIAGLKEVSSATNYHFLKKYSLAIESQDKGVYFMEL